MRHPAIADDWVLFNFCDDERPNRASAGSDCGRVVMHHNRAALAAETLKHAFRHTGHQHYDGDDGHRNQRQQLSPLKHTKK